MLFLSSGQQHQGKTVYHISVVLKETERDAPVPELGMGWITHTLVESSQPGEEIIGVPMENSPRLGLVRPKVDRCHPLGSTSRAKEPREEVAVEENEEELEEVKGEMKTDRFLKQPSKNSGKSSQQDRQDVAELAAQLDTEDQHIQSSSLCSILAKRNSYGHHGTGAGHSSLPRAVLQRPRQDEAWLARKTVSMYGDSVKQQRDSLPNRERRLRRPRSVCMLAGPGPGPVQLESHTHHLFERAGVLENDQQHRSRKAELRSVDGLNPLVQRPLVPAEVTPRVHQRSWKPRPVSMTVLELSKRGSDDEIDSKKSGRHTGGDGGGFLKGSFRWRLFGRVPQDKSKERESDKDAKSSPKFGKSDAPKSTLSSLRRSLSLRIKRTRPREKFTLGSETESNERSWNKSASEEATMPPRPFSYLTGRVLPTSSEQTGDGGMQYIQYHNKGTLKVMEVPLFPTKLSSKPVQEDPSLWQLIANRFRRKEQPFSGKCETQLSHSKGTGQHPPAGSNKLQPVTIETREGTNSHKGQGKTCKIAKFICSPPSPLIAPPSLCKKLQCKRNTTFFFF